MSRDRRGVGGDAVHALGYEFVWLPVLANALIMVLIAVVFNYGFQWRRDPAGLSRFTRKRSGSLYAERPSHDEIVSALRRLDLLVDIAEDDLVKLVKDINAKRRLRVRRESEWMDANRRVVLRAQSG